MTQFGYGSKIKPSGDRRFLSLFPFTRVPFWAPILDPHPFEPQLPAVICLARPKYGDPCASPSLEVRLGGGGAISRFRWAVLCLSWWGKASVKSAFGFSLGIL